MVTFFLPRRWRWSIFWSDAMPMFFGHTLPLLLMRFFGLNHRLWCFFLSYGNDFCWSPTNVCNNVSLKSTTIPPALLLDLANQSDAKIIKNPKHAVYIHGIEMVVPSQNWILILQNINRLHGCCCWFSFLLTSIREHKPAVPSCAEQPRLAAAPQLPRRSRAHSKSVSPGPVV